VIRVINPIVKFIYSVMLSIGAIAVLVIVPPMGLLLLLALNRHLRRETRHLRAA
jgi:hypothetical protein